MTESIWLWVGFNVFVLAMLALDLGVFHRKAHVVSLKESLTWTVVWIGAGAGVQRGRLALRRLDRRRWSSSPVISSRNR